MLQIRVSPEEKLRLERVAASKGISVSDLVRRGALGRRVPAVRGAAELEGSSGSAASPADTAASAASRDAGAGSAATEVVAEFRCPVGTCLPEGGPFEARSPLVVCPVHGCKLVPRRVRG